MDFIERIFHVAPDAGNGTLELAFVLIFLMLLLGVATLRIGVVRRYAGNARVKMQREALAATKSPTVPAESPRPLSEQPHSKGTVGDLVDPARRPKPDKLMPASMQP